jgi:hypothetical protein
MAGRSRSPAADVTTRFMVEMPRAPQMNEDTGTFKLEPLTGS